MRLDCEVWLQFLNEPAAVSRPFVDFDSSTFSAQELGFHTGTSRSANLGFRVVFDLNWTYHMWEENFIRDCQPSIKYLELYAVTVAIHLWACKLENRREVIFCNDLSVVHMVNSANASCKNCPILLRAIALKSLRHNVRFFLKHIVGEKNKWADWLNHNKVRKFLVDAGPEMSRQPEPIPQELWPISKIWKNFKN